jgi:hypothetical protein
MSFLLGRFALVFALTAASTPLTAADLPTPNNNLVQIKSLLERSAELYLIRAAFNVVLADDIPAMLVDDARRLATSGSNGSQSDAKISEALIAEGSYYITSLSYLISVGGANWPSDHPDSYFEAQTLPKLAEIQHDWLVQVSSGSDLKSLLLAIDQINAETEGYSELPASLDHFGAIDQMVDNAVKAAGIAGNS